MKAPYSRTLFELLCEQAANAPELTVVISEGVCLSYAELEVRARRVAQAMRETGVRRGDRVGLLSDNRIEWLEVLFAIPRFGKRSFADDIAALQASGAHRDLERVVLLGAEARDGFSLYSRYQQAGILPDLAPGEGASAADTLVVLYTSGSSNRPKAVPLIHCSTIENAFNIGERQGLVPGDRVFVSIPLFWSYGAVNALPASVSHGAALVLQGHFDAGGALDLIERHKCTAIYTLPAMTNALVGHPRFRS